MTKDVFDAIKERRSIRAFTNEKVPQATIARLVEAACQAPSAGNVQAWQFYIVTNESKKKALAEAALGQSFVSQAPVVIVVCAEPERIAQRYGSRGTDLYCLQDTAAAVENILLCAHAVGLGTCWVGAFDEGKVSQAVELPKDCRPVALIPVGYPAQEGRIRSQRPVEEVIHFLD